MGLNFLNLNQMSNNTKWKKYLLVKVRVFGRGEKMGDLKAEITRGKEGRGYKRNTGWKNQSR